MMIIPSVRVWRLLQMSALVRRCPCRVGQAMEPSGSMAPCRVQRVSCDDGRLEPALGRYQVREETSGCVAHMVLPTDLGFQPLSVGERRQQEQEAQLPQRESASATHVFLGSLTDRALHWAPHLFLPRDASAERGDATLSRLSVCLSVRPSVCNVQVPWTHRLKFFENNFTAE